jgi:hypothetical protein
MLKPVFAKDRPGFMFGALVVTAVLALGSFWTWQAPAGSWENRLFDFNLWIDNDPSEAYIPAANDLFYTRTQTSCACHPGLPLVFMLSGQQAALYGVARLAGAQGDITTWVARNTFIVGFVAKLGMVLLSLLSFLAIYQATAKLFGGRATAAMALFLYASSFTSLYFLNRVSVEQVLVAFFAWSIVAVVAAQEAPVVGWNDVRWAAAAGSLAMSALFTKLNLMVAWPLLAGVAVAFGTVNQSMVRRARLVGAYACGAGATFAFYSSFIDWQAYWATWKRQTLDPGTSPMPGFVATFLDIRSLDFVPAVTRNGLFSFFELPFIVAAAIGVAYAWRARRPRRVVLLCILANCAVSVVAWNYGTHVKNLHGFHYLFPVVAGLAPFAAFGLGAMLPAIDDPGRPRARRALECGLLVFLIHYGAVLAAFNSKQQDHRAFLAIGSSKYSEALARLSPGQRLAVIDGNPYLYHGLADKYALPDRRSRLVQAVDDLYFVREAPVGCSGFLRKAEERNVGAILDFRRDDPGPRTLEQWSALPEAGRCLNAVQ